VHYNITTYFLTYSLAVAKHIDPNACIIKHLQALWTHVSSHITHYMMVHRTKPRWNYTSQDRTQQRDNHLVLRKQLTCIWKISYLSGKYNQSCKTLQYVGSFSRRKYKHKNMCSKWVEDSFKLYASHFIHGTCIKYKIRSMYGNTQIRYKTKLMQPGSAFCSRWTIWAGP